MSEPEPKITWKLLPKQKRFLETKQREVLYSGAFGAGKTRAVCMKAVLRAMGRPGAVEGLARKHLSQLKRTTLRTLLEPEPGLPPVLLPGSYTHRVGENRIHVHNGGQIIYFGFGEGESESRTKIGSLLLSGCGVDQAEELSASEWTMLRGRVRLDVPDLKGQLYAVCNPASPSHHLAVRFGLDGEHKAQPHCLAIRTKSRDNHYLPPEYLDDLATFTGLAKSRYVEGLWVGSEGLVYDRWDRRIHVGYRDHGPWVKTVVGQDEGYTHPAVMLLIRQDEEGRVYVEHEWYKTRQLESDVVDQARLWQTEYGPDVFVIDPSAAKLREAMRAVGLIVEEANNDVFGGIQALQKRLAVVDGKPLLTVSPDCTNLIREFETYEWMPAGDRPRKEYDHAMDALRYACMSLETGMAPVLTSVSLADDPADRDDPLDDPEMWEDW